ncbi:ABC transporter substrate-binding protein [Edaphosphingomonas haloaromaticamans]|uniref:Thiamine pyrimidine synthase n=1 Tax=Edaphosphingomonas haloaromaticamans TaxID=653954 RepID=A0A1S1HAM0_9SPHN|nr:ABC transporter substrate-binding protein [Sphingomonas haloaromaticamans]OHT18676.1 NMT1/THI5 like protein [Sphingomonas haloaromaticamans]
MKSGPIVLNQTLSKIHLVVSPSTELLINGSVDARTGFTVNQQLALERMGYSTSAILPSDYGVNSYAEAIFTRPQILKSDPDLVRRFVAATVRGYDYAYSHQQETVGALMLANPQLDPAQQAAQLKHQAAYIYTEFSRAHGTCAFQPSVISQTQDILTQFGGLKRRVDIQNIYSTDYLPSKKGQ